LEENYEDGHAEDSLAESINSTTSATAKGNKLMVAIALQIIVIE
jgi:hypothetical protein